MPGTALPSSLRLFLTVLAIVFLAEGAVMMLLPLLLPGMDPFAAAITDALLLTILSSPFLWWVIVRPLRRSAMVEHTRAATIISNAVDAIITGDAQGLVESFNPAAEQLFGYQAEEVVGRPLTLLMPERCRNAHQAGLERARVMGTSDISGKALELHGLRKDGSEFPLEFSLGTSKTEKGTFFTAFLRATTERKRAEEQLHLQATALKAAVNAMVITDRQGTIVWVNPAFTHLTGYSGEEVLGQNPRLLKAGRHDQSFYQGMWQTILSGQVWHSEIINRRKDGTLYTEEQTITPVRDARGEITHFIAVKQDITKRMHAEEALRESEERYRDLVEHSEDLICTHDLEGRILSANQALARAFGFERPEELLGHKIGDYLAPDVRHLFKPYLDTVAKDGYAQGVMKVVTASGEERILEYKNSLRTEGVKRPIVRGRSHDVTERARAEKGLAKRAERMQALRAITVEITQQLDLTDLLDLVTRRAAELIGAVSGAIYLWNEATQVLSAEAWRGLGEWMRGLRLGLGEGVAGAVAQRRRGLIVNDYRTSSYASPLFLERTRFTAVIAEPFLYHERLIGVLAINNEGTGHFFTEEDRILLSLFAAQAGIAIQNARLYDTVHQRAERIAAINRLTRVISSSLDLGTVYGAFAKEVKHLIAYDRMGIVVPDGSGEGLRIVQLTSDRPTTAGRGSLWPKRAGTAIEWVMVHRRPQIERDLGEDRLFVEDEVLFREGIRSSVRLPLIAKGEAIGALFLDSTRPDCYAESDLELLVPLGEQLAIAIDNSRLYEGIQEDARFRTALAEVARTITSMLEIDAISTLVCERMQNLFQVDGCYLWTLDETAQELVGAAASGHKFEEFTGLKISMDQEDSLSARVARMRKPQVVQDVATSEFAGPPLSTIFDSRSLLALPLVAKESLVGVVILNDIHETHRFDEALIRRAEIFASQAAIAIENARLHLDLRESKEKVEELYTLGVTMQEQMSLEKRLDLILTGTKAVLGFDRINILLPDPEMKMLKAVASVGVEEPLEQIRVPLGPAGGGIAKAFLDRTEIVWGGSGLVPEEWRLGHPYSEIQAFRSKAFVIVPLIVGGRPIGVLGADNKATRKPISAERVRLLRTFATQAALAIDNARLYEEVTGQAKELERKVEERTKALKETQVQLIQSGKLAAVGTLAAGVAHELNQPLMVIRGYAQELLEDERIADAELREDLSRIEAQTTRMTAIISHLRDFSRQSKGTRQRTDLNQVVTQAFSFLDQQLRTRNIEVVQALDPSLPPVWADPLQIEQVLLNLVTNARDAMEKVGKGVMVIRTEQARDGRVALSVTDTGPGVPPDLKARIFDPFFTTKEVGKGTGLGLSICHGIAEEHGGELRVESPVAEDRGARFTLVLPRSLRDASGGERG